MVFETYRARTNVPGKAHLHDVVQSLHCLLPWDIGVHTLDLEDVDVRAQPLDARLHRIKYVFPGQPGAVHQPTVVDSGREDRKLWLPGTARGESAFGQDDDVFSGDLVGGKGFGDDFFRNTV